ncbi:hypothetical protein SEA_REDWATTLEHOG_128 [Gordonia phage RedWattleHog]|nr:hypothetical protein SEA_REDWATTLEHOG_128 [Gordonia phage RedWattleHog]
MTAMPRPSREVYEPAKASDVSAIHVNLYEVWQRDYLVLVTGDPVEAQKTYEECLAETPDVPTSLILTQYVRVRQVGTGGQ